MDVMQGMRTFIAVVEQGSFAAAVTQRLPTAARRLAATTAMC